MSWLELWAVPLGAAVIIVGAAWLYMDATTKGIKRNGPYVPEDWKPVESERADAIRGEK